MGNTKGPVYKHFTSDPVDPDSTLKVSRATCKHCGHSLVEQANRMNKHLEKCLQYQKSMSKRDKPALDIATSVHRCRPMEQQRFDKLAGMAIFAGGFLFSTFNKKVKPDMWTFIHGLNTA